MNALVGYRGNSLGNLSVTRTEQEEATRQITSTFRAKSAAATQKSTSSKQITTAEATEAPNNELGRDAFLQLLVLELQNQDPLEPVDNADMIAQLAQFASLEEMENLNNSFELISGNMDQLNFISAQGLIGKYVEGVNDSGEIAVGTVNSVYLDGSIVVLNVDGEIVSMSNVLSIADEAPEEDAESDNTSGASNDSEKRGVIDRLGSTINNLFH
ncbi:MAG: flagellar hook capping protein [Candidatus Hydrogenedentes bacterium]|nr:flagellar hook capping protein [Candidatus Hydrogenedentota bacterium]